jgi:hypothetical protein
MWQLQLFRRLPWGYAMPWPATAVYSYAAEQTSSSSGSQDIPSFLRIFQLQTTEVLTYFSGGWLQATGGK